MGRTGNTAASKKPSSTTLSPSQRRLKASKNPKETLSDSEEIKETPEDPQLASLEFQIHSKERTLSLLNSKLPGDEQLHSQLTDRDRMIEKLNKQIAVLQGKVQMPELASLLQKDKQLKQVLKEKLALTQQVADLENQLLKSQSETVDLQKSKDEEKRNLEMINEGLTEELETLRSAVKSKDENLQSAKHDIIEMSRIVKELSDMNSDFNEKILSMNRELEKKNKDTFTAVALAKQTEEMEKELVQVKTENQRLTNRASKLTKMKSSLVILEDTIKTSREGLRVVYEKLRAITPPDSLLLDLERLMQTLGKATKERNVSDDPVLLMEDIRILKMEIAELKTENAKLMAVQGSYVERIKELEGEKESIKQDLLATNEKLKKRVKTYQEAMESFKAKADSLEEKCEKLDGNYQKAQTLTVALQSQLAVIKQKKSTETTSEEHYSNTIKDLKSQLAQIRSQKLTSELSIANRERVLKKHAIQLKVLTDEIWQKDTENMRLMRVLEGQNGGKVFTEREAEALVKVKSAANLSTASEEIRGRDREIEMLKDMLKSANQQVKAKEQDIARLRKKLESLPEPVSTSGPATQPADTFFTLIQEYDAVQVAIERVQREPKVPKQVVRSVLKSALVPEGKTDVTTQLVRRLREVYERLEAQCKKQPKSPVSLRTNVLLNSGKLRELAQETDLTFSSLSARLRPE